MEGHAGKVGECKAQVERSFAPPTIVQEASWPSSAFHNSSSQAGKNDRKPGRAKRAALIGDDQRTLPETTQRGSRAPAPIFPEQKCLSVARRAKADRMRVSALAAFPRALKMHSF